MQSPDANPPWPPFHERGRGIRDHNVVLVILEKNFGRRFLFQKGMEVFGGRIPLLKKGEYRGICLNVRRSYVFLKRLNRKGNLFNHIIKPMHHFCF